MTGRLASIGFILHIAPLALAAQANAAIEIAGTRVTYDGFLRSNAVTIAPSVSFVSPRASAIGAGIATFFESGSRSGVLSLDGAWRAASGRQTALEMRGSAGASFYTFSDPAVELLGGARVRRWNRSFGMWAGADAGAVAGRLTTAGVARLDLGAWWRRRGVTVRLSATPTALGGGEFTDAIIDASWRTGRLEIGAAGGYRSSAKADLEAPFAAIVAHFRLRRGMDAGLAWGRALPDMLRASPGARYAMFSIRLRSRSVPSRAMPRTPELGDSASPALHSVVRHGDSTVIVLRARGAERMELSGDFTDWEPHELQRAEGDRWRAAFALRPGVYQFNVRVNGREWSVPAGVGRVKDDFGGEAAVLVVHPPSR